MKISVKNLGVLKQAEFSLGDLTIICGQNNTGKTYAAYALYGFLYTWHEMFSLNISDKQIKRLLLEGVIHLDIRNYIETANQIIEDGCRNYTEHLSKIFASSSKEFLDATFQVALDIQEQPLIYEYSQKVGSAKVEMIAVTKNKESDQLDITLLVDKEKVKFPTNVIKEIISASLQNIIFSPSIPNPFIASAERTGAAIFRRELNFARNRLLEEMSQSTGAINPIEFLLKVYQDYPLPVQHNVDFTRQLEGLVTKTSFLVTEYPEILEEFADIIGGKYTVKRNDELYYVPKGKRVKLSMDESSSAVRSLLDIGFYLKHEARRGDLLIVDEPELNLHPENQRRIARLFARLINVGIRVFITTHSDYIIKELNTLIMLNQDSPHLKKILEEEGYNPEELISHKQVEVYIAEAVYMVPEGKKRKSKCHTFVPAKIGPEFGIEARSFDQTIETMNRIQSAIVWGDD